MFLKASNAPLGPFNNEHRDRSALLQLEEGASEGEICLDRSPQAIFDDGWHEPDDLPPIARWLKTKGRIRFRAQQVRTIRLDLTTHLPDLGARKMNVALALNGAPLATLTVFRYGWIELEFRLPDPVTSSNGENFELEITADQTWRPRPDDKQNRDDREISVAICNLCYS